jgi:hypothetical protein
MIVVFKVLALPCGISGGSRAAFRLAGRPIATIEKYLPVFDMVDNNYQI